MEVRTLMRSARNAAKNQRTEKIGINLLLHLKRYKLNRYLYAPQNTKVNFPLLHVRSRTD